MSYDPNRKVVLTVGDVDAICDVFSAISFAMVHAATTTDKIRSAGIIDAIVQELSCKFDLPEGPQS